MKREEMIRIVRAHAARMIGCAQEDLLREETVFVQRQGASDTYLKIATMGRGTVVCASSDILGMLHAQLAGKRRDEIFEHPFVYGQSIYYLPEKERIAPTPMPQGYTLKLYEENEVYNLEGVGTFPNTLDFDGNGTTSTCIVLCAYAGDEVTAMAGASRQSATVWEMGVDVTPACRRAGLASALVSRLAQEILLRGVIPIYCASVTNIASQAVAHRSGLIPWLMSTYGHIFDGNYAYGGLIHGGTGRCV